MATKSPSALSFHNAYRVKGYIVFESMGVTPCHVPREILSTRRSPTCRHRCLTLPAAASAANDPAAPCACCLTALPPLPLPRLHATALGQADCTHRTWPTPRQLLPPWPPPPKSSLQTKSQGGVRSRKQRRTAFLKEIPGSSGARSLHNSCQVGLEGVRHS